MFGLVLVIFVWVTFPLSTKSLVLLEYDYLVLFRTLDLIPYTPSSCPKYLLEHKMWINKIKCGLPKILVHPYYHLPTVALKTQEITALAKN